VQSVVPDQRDGLAIGIGMIEGSLALSIGAQSIFKGLQFSTEGSHKCLSKKEIKVVCDSPCIVFFLNSITFGHYVGGWWGCTGGWKC